MAKQHDYHVTWEIDITASSPQSAARQARAHVKRRGSIATVYTVHREGKEPVKVDLTELAEERATKRLAKKTESR